MPLLLRASEKHVSSKKNFKSSPVLLLPWALLWRRDVDYLPMAKYVLTIK